FRDITKHKQDQQRLAAVHAVTRILAESLSVSSAIPALLETIGSSLGWQAATYWTVDETSNILRCLSVWHRPADPFEAFERACYATTFTRDSSLPGRVWQSLRPVWIPDLAKDSNFVRAKETAAASLRAAFAFPILSADKLLGAMEFFASSAHAPDESLLA